MRALVIPRHGPPSVFEERELPDRRLTPKDVRVQVEAAGVNFADLMGRVGLYPDAPPMPYAPGYEVAGTVVEAGERVADTLPVGTRVMATTRFWGYADHVRIPAHWAVAIPDAVDWATAAAIPVNYLTAYLALIHCGCAREGDRVLVHGGAGGVGLAVLDLARPLDIELYATAGSREKCERLESLGVTRAFDYRTEDVESAARKALRGHGFELILDPLGPESFQRSLRMLSPLGRVVCYGFLATGDWSEAQALARGDQVAPSCEVQPDHADESEQGRLRSEPGAAVHAASVAHHGDATHGCDVGRRGFATHAAPDLPLDCGWCRRCAYVSSRAQELRQGRARSRRPRRGLRYFWCLEFAHLCAGRTRSKTNMNPGLMMMGFLTKLQTAICGPVGAAREALGIGFAQAGDFGLTIATHMTTGRRSLGGGAVDRGAAGCRH